jgi:putative transcriptional regulator
VIEIGGSGLDLICRYGWGVLDVHLGISAKMEGGKSTWARSSELRTNPRTLENWEQGRAKPNAQAVLLIRKVSQFPDTMKRLESV